MGLSFIEFLKVVFLGIVEGITEWLPISSTGHMLLVDEFISLDASEQFKEMFFVIIQLGAILAVVLLFWKKMFPFQFKDKEKSVIRKDVFSIWFKTAVACVPGTVVTLLFDDYIEAHLHTPVVIATALVFYGVAFILISYTHRNEYYYLTFKKLTEFWDRAAEGGRKSFRYEELEPAFFLPEVPGILVPYLNTLQLDLNCRA